MSVDFCVLQVLKNRNEDLPSVIRQMMCQPFSPHTILNESCRMEEEVMEEREIDPTFTNEAEETFGTANRCLTHLLHLHLLHA